MNHWRFTYRNHLPFILFILFYALLGLFNLTTLPVAWTDEVMNLDPAIQFHRFGHFFSKLWPNPGAEKVFASYPPLIEIWHIIWLKLVNPTVFNIRLPFLIFHLITLTVLYFILIKSLKNKYISLLFLLLFAFDKSVFELSRSVRVEVLILLLISLYYLFQTKSNNPFLQGFLSGLLLIAHLYTLPIVLAWLIKTCFKNSYQYTIKYGISLVLPTLFSLWLINFNVAEIISQLGLQATKHTPQSNGFFYILRDSFLGRFFPYYYEQPLMWFVYLGILFLAIHLLIKQRTSIESALLNGSLLELLLLGITIFGAMSAQYRYLPAFLLIGIITFASEIKLNNKIFKALILIIVLNGFLSFTARHITAIYQRQERTSEPILAFLDKNIPQNKKILILGESIGEYYSATHKLCDYGLDFHPIHFRFADYENVYFLSKDSTPYLNCTKIGQYNPLQNQIPPIISKFAKGGTYSNTFIWKVESESEFKKITQPFLNY